MSNSTDTFSANTVDKTFNSGKLTPINFDKNVNLFDRSISCNSGQVSGSANLKVVSKFVLLL